MTSDTKLNKRCSLCGGNNTPHQMDEYHQFLQALEFSNAYLKNAEVLSKKLPSIQIQLTHTIDSMNSLKKEAKLI